jgi:hypothetical protein
VIQQLETLHQVVVVKEETLVKMVILAELVAVVL